MYPNYIKRLIDIVIAIILLPFLFLLTVFIGFLIKIEDKGSIIYKSPRLGKDGAIFQMYKFRTMKENAPDYRNPDGSTFNSEEDPRLTKVGSFLRKTSIDELPQLINVVLGDMSLIGPRPDLPEHMEQYTQFEKKKIALKPGITGYNQAYFRNTIPWKERLKNDVYYVENISFILDFKITLKTIVSVIKIEKIYNEEKI